MKEKSTRRTNRLMKLGLSSSLVICVFSAVTPASIISEVHADDPIIENYELIETDDYSFAYYTSNGEQYVIVTDLATNEANTITYNSTNNTVWLDNVLIGTASLDVISDETEGGGMIGDGIQSVGAVRYYTYRINLNRIGISIGTMVGILTSIYFFKTGCSMLGVSFSSAAANFSSAVSNMYFWISQGMGIQNYLNIYFHGPVTVTFRFQQELVGNQCRNINRYIICSYGTYSGSISLGNGAWFYITNPNEVTSPA